MVSKVFPSLLHDFPPFDVTSFHGKQVVDASYWLENTHLPSANASSLAGPLMMWPMRAICGLFLPNIAPPAIAGHSRMWSRKLTLVRQDLEGKVRS